MLTVWLSENSSSRTGSNARLPSHRILAVRDFLLSHVYHELIHADPPNYRAPLSPDQHGTAVGKISAETISALTVAVSTFTVRITLVAAFAAASLTL